MRDDNERVRSNAHNKRRGYRVDVQSIMELAEERNIKQTAMKVAKKMLAKGYPLNEVIECTMLSLEEIENIN